MNTFLPSAVCRAARNALYIDSAEPNEAAAALPEAFLNDPLIYPNQTIQAKSETGQALPRKLIKRHKKIMQDLHQAIR
ncbi:hypothetical protein [uncultured Oceanisphaera sp.]|uniref:hypothetical protein n=1 Tax=uncultured Oceanisphaera sp. TaxID=353858 RepID=UPI0026117204|nr:hypothetical protein [uncultured Oceanisphaera sp.]